MASFEWLSANRKKKSKKEGKKDKERKKEKKKERKKERREVNRERHKNRYGAVDFCYLFETGPLNIHLVDEANAGQLMETGLTPHCFRLRLYT